MPELAQLSSNNIFHLLLICSRVGSIMMLLPGIGDSYLAIRFRMLTSLTISYLILPLIPDLPQYQSSVIVISELVIKEILIGIFIGINVRLLLSIVNIVGSMISSNSGLGSAMLFDPTEGSQSVIISSFFTILTITLIFISDMHHIFIKSFVESYNLFKVGSEIEIQDMSNHFIKISAEIFVMSLKMMAPSILASILMMLVAGIISRIMPSLQIFFLMTPIQILVSFSLILITLSTTMMWYLNYIAENWADFNK